MDKKVIELLNDQINKEFYRPIFILKLRTFSMTLI